MRTLHSTFLTIALLPMLLQAQDPCNGLSLISLTNAPFTDTALKVVLHYEGLVFMHYPQCILIDAEGDTVAVEQMNFFGIPPGENTHRMDLLPGVQLPASPFTGTLAVHYASPDSLGVCYFDLVNVALCPGECEDLEVFVFHGSGGGAAVDSSFPWNVTNDDGEIVASGMLVIQAADQQQDLEALCLSPGAYILHMQQTDAVGLNFTAGVTQGTFTTNGPQQSFQPGGSIDLPFTYYPGCVSIGQSIEPMDRHAPLIIVLDRIVHITSKDGESLRQLQVLDSTGRLVATSDSRSNQATIDLSSVASGIFIIRSLDGMVEWVPQRFMLP